MEKNSQDATNAEVSLLNINAQNAGTKVLKMELNQKEFLESKFFYFQGISFF